MRYPFRPPKHAISTLVFGKMQMVTKMEDALESEHNPKANDYGANRSIGAPYHEIRSENTSLGETDYSFFSLGFLSAQENTLP